jgi:mono/diheme cytochrome c family protein
MRERCASPLLLLAGLGLLAAGCRGWTSSRPPVHINPSMYVQPKYRPQSESAFFYDGATMRAPVPGTVAREDLLGDPAFDTGKDAHGQDLAHSPVEATPEVLARGAQRYAIYCQPCHDPHGEGKGILFQRGNVPTASFFEAKVENAPDGHIFDVVTNGLGLMPSYRWPIPPADRWAIIAHVRELERQRRQQTGATP